MDGRSIECREDPRTAGKEDATDFFFGRSLLPRFRMTVETRRPAIARGI